MSELLGDLQRVNQIWKCIQAIDDEGLEEERGEVSRKYKVVVNSLNTAIERESAEPRTPIDALTVVNVIDFVCGAYAFYGKIRSYRQFTAKEREVHGVLTSLLSDADAMIASTVDSEAPGTPVMAAEKSLR